MLVHNVIITNKVEDFSIIEPFSTLDKASAFLDKFKYKHRIVSTSVPHVWEFEIKTSILDGKAETKQRVHFYNWP